MNLTGEPFLGCDYYYSKGDIQITNMGVNIIESIKNINNKIPIIFIQSDLINYYLIQLINLNNKFILITVNSDDICLPFYNYPTDNKELEQLSYNLLNSQNLVKWFTKNPCIIHDKIAGIPIGPKWNWYSHNFFGEDKRRHLEIFYKYCINPHINIQNIELKKNLLYFNYSIDTTNGPLYSLHKNIRKNVYDILISKGFPYNENTDFENYIKILSTYKFSISPPGRGIDTHRAWESLMVGTIPIMLHTPIDNLFEKLPVILVDDYSIITEDFLNNKYNEIIQKNYDFSILYSYYWDHLFKNISN